MKVHTLEDDMTNEAIATIYEAQKKMREAYDLLMEACNLLDEVEGQDSRYAKVYLVDHFRIMIDDNHSFFCNDLNCDTWIADIKERDEEINY